MLQFTVPLRVFRWKCTWNGPDGLLNVSVMNLAQSAMLLPSAVSSRTTAGFLIRDPAMMANGRRRSQRPSMTLGRTRSSGRLGGASGPRGGVGLKQVLAAGCSTGGASGDDERYRRVACCGTARHPPPGLSGASGAVGLHLGVPRLPWVARASGRRALESGRPRGGRPRTSGLGRTAS